MSDLWPDWLVRRQEAITDRTAGASDWWIRCYRYAELGLVEPMLEQIPEVVANDYRQWVLRLGRDQASSAPKAITGVVHVGRAPTEFGQHLAVAAGAPRRWLHDQRLKLGTKVAERVLVSSLTSAHRP